MRPRTFDQLIILAFCGLLAAGVIRTHVVEDDRYGFCMFRDVVRVKLAYAWVWPDGRVERFDTKDELRGDAHQIRQTRGKDSIFGIGATRAMVGNFVDYMGARRPDDDARFEAVLQWRKYDRGPWIEERYSSADASP